MRKLFTIILLAILCVNAMAYDFSAVCSTGQTLYYNINSNVEPYTVEVTSENATSPYYTTYPTGDLEIPETVEYNSITYSVTSIGNYALYKSSGLSSLIIPNSVTSIGDYAIRDCSGLTSITIPNSVTSIGTSAFYHVRNVMYDGTATGSPWSALTVNGYVEDGLVYTDNTKEHLTGCSTLATSVNISSSVISIGDYTFDGCTGLTSVTIPNSVITIGHSAFAGCSGLTEITIGNSVTSIGNYAFYNCSGLTSIDMPNSVTSVGESAITGTGWLNNQPDGILYLGDWCLGYKSDWPTGSFAIQDGIKNICDKAFYACNQITELTIPNSVKNIGARAFSRCTELTTVNFNAENCTTMGNSGYKVFEDGTTLTTLNIGERVKNIPSYAFYNCSGLAEITIPDSVTSIGDWAFYGCSGLVGTLTIPESVESIGNQAFQGCSGLTTVNFNAENCTSMGTTNYAAFYNGSFSTLNIGERVKNIPDYAFYDCDGLTEVTIPDAVTSIGERAFENCTGLTEITIPDSVTNIGTYAFSSCSSLDTVTIGKGVESIGERAFSECSGLTTLNFNAENCTTMGSYGMKALESCTALNSLNIGANVKNIPDYAFDGCSVLSGALVIPDSVTNIGTYAFGSCSSIDTVNIGKGVESIGERAFYNCTELTTVNFNAKNCTTMGSLVSPAFNSCSSFSTLNIGEDVKNIPAYAFRNCDALTEVTISDSVTNIGEQAFIGCYGLSSVYYTGNIDKWCGITFSEPNANPLDYAHNLYIDNILLTDLSIPETVTELKGYAFIGATCLTSVTIPNSVTSIGNSAFQSCREVTEITIGNSVENIGDGAFKFSESITNINIKANAPPALGENIFTETTYNSATLWTPCTLDETYRNDSQWGQFTNIQNDTAANLVVEVQTADADMGSVTGDGTFSCETEAIITATPNQGYRFLSWNDGNEDNPRTIVVTKDSTFTAGFKATYIITATAGEGGTISPNGETTVDEGGSQSFTITPNECYQIASVMVDGEDVTADLVEGVYTFDNVTTGHTIAATFEQITYTITATAGNGGTINIENSVNCGENILFTVTPNACYEIGTVTVNGTVVALDDNNSYTIANVTEPQNINVTFNQITYIITASAGNGGSITPSGNTIVNCGDNKTFTIIPNEYYRIAMVSVDDIEVTSDLVDGEYTFENVTADHTIAVTFEEITYTITATAGNGGSISPTGAVIVTEGSSQAFTILPNEAYRIATVIVDGENNVTAELFENVYTFENVIADHTIAVTFEEIPVEASFTTNPEASVNTLNIAPGDLVEYTSISINAHHIAWTFEGGDPATSTDNYVPVRYREEGTFLTTLVAYNEDETLTDTATLTVVVSTVSYTITVLANDDAYGTVTGGGTYAEGTQVLITATPYEGYRFVSWDDGHVGNPRYITITGDSTFVANFESDSIFSTITESFEPYELGSYMSEVAAPRWELWTDGVMGGLVSDEQAHYGIQSMKVYKNGSIETDVVLNVNDLTAGRYKVEFYMYVPVGNTGYYNILQDNDGSDSKYGIQLTFNDSIVTIDANGKQDTTNTYIPESWIKIQQYIDLDNDWSELYLNDALVAAYQWSKGQYGNGTTCKFDAIDFYSHTINNQAGLFYIDDITIGQAQTFEAPTDLTATVQNELDVLLSWTAVDNDNIVFYSVSLDGEEIATTTETTYIDEHLYPMTYNYQVRAYYGQEIGYSAAANAQATIEGSYERENILVELFAYRGCGYSPYAAKALDDMEASDSLNIIVLDHHITDTYGNTQSYARFHYWADRDNMYGQNYGFDGTPSVVFDGYIGLAGASTNVTDMQNTYATYYNYVKDIKSIYSLTAELEQTEFNGRTFSLNVTAEKHSEYFGDDQIVVMAALAEDIDYDWSVAGKINNLVRVLYPDENGTEAIFDGNNRFSTSFSITISEEYDISKCKVVVWVENHTQGRVMQSKRFNVMDFYNLQAQQYTITVLSNNDAYGSVSGSGTYYDGDTVVILAMPNSGYNFVSWDDGYEFNPRAVVVTSDSTFIADFVKCEITYAIDTVVNNFVTVGDHTFYSTGNYTFAVSHETACDTIFDIRLRVLAEPVYDIGPNPTKSLLNINSDGFISAVEFYSVTGQLVMRKEVNGYEAEFDMEGLVDGVYILRIYGEESSLPAVYRIVKE